MNANFFGLKRAFHGTLRITRPSLTKLGLTAARFDLLYALPQDMQRFEQGMRQSDLGRQIGVSRPTVSACSLRSSSSDSFAPSASRTTAASASSR